MYYARWNRSGEEVNDPQIAPDLPVATLQMLSDALLDAAIAEKGTAYIIIVANGGGDFSTSFNVDRPSLKKILTKVLEQMPDTDDAPTQS